MGRASNRKKAQHQAGLGAGRASRKSRAAAETQRAMHVLVSGLQALVREGNDRKEREAAGAVPPAGVLPVGLSLLSALAQLCRSGSASILQRPALSRRASPSGPRLPGPGG